MELFPAADEEQFQFIKRVIDDCDYYLLIIGGRYGSIAQDGTSYTEQEYDYAVSRGLKVIALVHEDPDSIPLGKSEKDSVLRERLQRFREKVSANRLVKPWKAVHELPGLVLLSLQRTIRSYPAVGWVRATRPANEEVLGEINELRKENAQLQARLTELVGQAQPHIDNLAGLGEKFTARGSYYSRFYGGTRRWSVDATWREIFGYLSPYLAEWPNDSRVKSVLQSALFAQSGEEGSSPELDDQLFRTISIQLKALGLVNVAYTEAVGGGMGLFWSLTSIGERLMTEVRAVRAKTQAKG